MKKREHRHRAFAVLIAFATCGCASDIAAPRQDDLAESPPWRSFRHENVHRMRQSQSLTATELTTRLDIFDPSGAQIDRIQIRIPLPSRPQQARTTPMASLPLYTAWRLRQMYDDANEEPAEESDPYAGMTSAADCEARYQEMLTEIQQMNTLSNTVKSYAAGAIGAVAAGAASEWAVAAGWVAKRNPYVTGGVIVGGFIGGMDVAAPAIDYHTAVSLLAAQMAADEWLAECLEEVGCDPSTEDCDPDDPELPPGGGTDPSEPESTALCRTCNATDTQAVAVGFYQTGEDDYTTEYVEEVVCIDWSFAEGEDENGDGWCD